MPTEWLLSPPTTHVPVPISCNVRGNSFDHIAHPHVSHSSYHHSMWIPKHKNQTLVGTIVIVHYVSLVQSMPISYRVHEYTHDFDISFLGYQDSMYKHFRQETHPPKLSTDLNRISVWLYSSLGWSASMRWWWIDWYCMIFSEFVNRFFL
jgi:hypothetical protein